MENLPIDDLAQMHDFVSCISGPREENNDLLEFLNIIHYHTRFFLNDHPIFDRVKNLFDGCKISLTPDETIFRARKYDFSDNLKLQRQEGFWGFNRKDSFVPPIKFTQANRANSTGIPCLYTSKDIKTAIAETRPFLGNKISVSEIKPKRELKLFDFYIDPSRNYLEILRPPHSDLWLDIAIYFSRPYENSSKDEYLFTQCISDFLRLSSFDGIQYSSSLNEGGKNVAIFNCRNEDDCGDYDICEPMCSHTYIVNRIDHCFGRTS